MYIQSRRVARKLPEIYIGRHISRDNRSRTFYIHCGTYSFQTFILIGGNVARFFDETEVVRRQRQSGLNARWKLSPNVDQSDSLSRSWRVLPVANRILARGAAARTRRQVARLRRTASWSGDASVHRRPPFRRMRRKRFFFSVALKIFGLPHRGSL